MMEEFNQMGQWDKQRPVRRKCQFCKQERKCKHGPDPTLYFFFDEIEMVWLCEACFDVRVTGEHLPDLGDDEVPEWL